MTKAKRPIVCSAAVFAIALHASAAQAQGPHTNVLKAVATPTIATYVSGTGNDINPCTSASPCRTFRTALNITLPGGTVYVLDSADYGPITINKAVSIFSEGAVAGILATSGAAIVVNAGASDNVYLSGLDIDGSNSGSIGVQFMSGQSLNIQKSTVRNFTNARINFAPASAGSLYVTNTALTNNATNGLLITKGSATVSRVQATGNGVGLFAAGQTVKLTIADTVSNQNIYGIGASSSAVMVSNSDISNNSIGVMADQSAVVRIGQSSISANGTGWQASNGGQIQSFGTNNVDGNTADGAPTGTVALN